MYDNSDEKTKSPLIDKIKENLPKLSKEDTLMFMSDLVNNKDLSEKEFLELMLNKYPHITEDTVKDLWKLNGDIDKWAERKVGFLENNYKPTYNYRILLEEI